MLAWIAYGVVAVVWGSTYFAIAVGIESFTPYGMVASRYLLAGVAALGLSRLAGEPLPSREEVRHLVVQGALLLSVSNALVTWAEKEVASSVAAVICSITPLLYGLMGGERLDARGWGGLLLGVAGVAILVNPLGGAMKLTGVFAILLATVVWAWGTLHGRRHVKGRGLFGQVAVQMLAGGTIGLVAAPLTGGFLHHPLTWRAGLAVLYLMVFGSLAAYSAFIYLARAWPPSKMGTYAYLNPLVAVLLGVAFLHEPFNLRMALGMAVILAAVALVQIRPKVPAKILPKLLQEG
ncbi:MAG: EamA family transporter [Acidobacteria bacterium]|nr:EamA family transporter [Acidobacteriota bacterium]